MSETGIRITAAQPVTGYTGELSFRITGPDGFSPVANATVSISIGGQPENIIEQVRTDESGLTERVDLSAPPLEYSMEPGENQPYTQYTATVLAEGYDPFEVEGIQVLEPERNDECCGFGGMFSVEETAVSTQMGIDKVQRHMKTGARFVTGPDCSCLMHMAGVAKKQGLNVEFKHVVEILAAGL